MALTFLSIDATLPIWTVVAAVSVDMVDLLFVG
jgi:hypothetical protein